MTISREEATAAAEEHRNLNIHYQTLLALDKAARAVYELSAGIRDGLCGWSGDPAGMGEGLCGCEYCALRECLLSEMPVTRAHAREED